MICMNSNRDFCAVNTLIKNSNLVRSICSWCYNTDTTKRTWCNVKNLKCLWITDSISSVSNVSAKLLERQKLFVRLSKNTCAC